MKTWEIRSTRWGLILLPTQRLASRLYCPFCAVPLVYHHFTCFERTTYPPRHCDVMLKCPICEHAIYFGVSQISEDDVKALKASPLHGKVLDGEKAVEITNMYLKVGREIIKIINERMRSWGYW